LAGLWWERRGACGGEKDGGDGKDAVYGSCHDVTWDGSRWPIVMRLTSHPPVKGCWMKD
jgi:hypothetical protein